MARVSTALLVFQLHKWPCWLATSVWMPQDGCSCGVELLNPLFLMACALPWHFFVGSGKAALIALHNAQHTKLSGECSAYCVLSEKANYYKSNANKKQAVSHTALCIMFEAASCIGLSSPFLTELFRECQARGGVKSEDQSLGGLFLSLGASVNEPPRLSSNEDLDQVCSCLVGMKTCSHMALYWISLTPLL